MAMRRLDINPPAPSTPQGLLRMATANPLEDVLANVEKFGQRAAVTSAAQSAESAVMSGENPGLSLGITPAGQAYNEAAVRAYETRTSMDIRAKQAELSAKFTGMSPTDPQAFAETMGGYVSGVLANVPDAIRPQIAAESRARMALSVAEITAKANQFELRRNDSAILAGIQADVEEAAVLARDGAPVEAIGALYARADSRIDWRVERGLIAPEEAVIAKQEYRSGIQAEAIFGQALRSGTGVRVLHELDTGGAAAQGLTLKQRDSLKAKLTAEMNRREADAQRADAQQARLGKAEREIAATQMWAKVYSPNSADRPNTDAIVTAQRAGILSASDAEQMIRTMATSKEARTDMPTLSRLEQEAAEGIDITERINEAIRDGRLAYADAGPLFERNKEAQSEGLPNPVKSARDGVVTIFRETSQFGVPNAGEQERRVDALAFFDEQVRNAPSGVDPATGLPMRQVVAERTLALLTERHRSQQKAQLIKVPPRGAVTVKQPATAGIGAPPVLDVTATVAKLKADRMAGIITDTQYAAELRIIERWKDAGLVVQ